MPADLQRALNAYRIMAFVVGTMLIILVAVAVPLQFAAGKPALEHVVGPLHGALYIIYLLAAANLARKASFSLWQLVAMVAAGFVPGLAFVVEHRTTKRVLLQAEADQRPAANTADNSAGTAESSWS